MEFGTGSIPARSWIGRTFDQKRNEVQSDMARLLGHIVDGKVSVDKALNVLGAKYSAAVKTPSRKASRSRHRMHRYTRAQAGQDCARLGWRSADAYRYRTAYWVRDMGSIRGSKMSYADSITSLANATLTVTRRRQAAPVDGRDQAPTTSTFTIVASAQPTSGRDLQRLPDGKISADLWTVYTKTRLYLGATDAGTEGATFPTSSRSATNSTRLST